MKKIYYLVLVFTIYFQTKAQLSGIITVPSTYTSLASVIAALNQQGASGSVTVNIAAGYTETVIPGGFSLTASGSLNNPIVFQKNGNGANPLLVAYSGGTGTPGSMHQDGVWRLLGCDYVTIDGIDIVDQNTVNPATMEFGIGLFKANSNNGCQNNTIKNCSITLNRINNSSGSGPAEDGSRGIDVVNATSSVHNSTISVTSISGSNSNNKFYTNTIQNCNIGMSLIGFVDFIPFSFADNGNDIGGNSVLTGNSILNFGGGGSTNSSCAIKTLAQYNLNVAYNIINNNTGNGINHPTLLRGIYLGASISANSSVMQNTITLNGGATSAQLSVIENLSGSGALNNTITISNNCIINCSYNTSTSGPFYGIWNNASPENLSMSNNIFLNNSTSAASGSTYLIYNNGAVGSTINISGNALSFTYNGPVAYSGNMYSIYNTNGTNTTVVNMNNNNFSNYNHINFAATGAIYFIYNTNDSYELHLNNNTWTNLSLNHSGAEYLINNNSSTQSQLTVNGNNIIGSLNRTASTGATYLYYNTGSSPANCTQIILGNNFSNITSPVSGTGVFYGIYTTDGLGTSYPRKQICNNLISTINVNSTGAFYAYYLENLGDGNTNSSSAIYSNTVSNVTRAGNLYGLYIGSLVSANYAPHVYTNTLLNLNSSGSSSTIYASYLLGGGSGLNFYKNKISTINANGTSGVGHGVYITSAVNTTLSNNFIGHVNAPNSSATNAVNGIYINSGTLINLWYNTVYLGAQSAGGNFNSNALYASTASSLSLKNNIFINVSSGGTGISAAYRRSSTSLTNYLSTSNNNLFYGGIPSPSNVILQNGTTSYTALSAFQTLVNPRESLSATQSVNFLSSVPSSPNYLHVTPNVFSAVESGAVNVSGITNDYDNQIRQGNTGYVGSGSAPDIGADEYDQNINPCASANAGIISPNAFTLCAGQSASLISNGYSPGVGLSHQWKVSPTSGSSYTNVTNGNGVTTPEFYSSALTAGVYYFVLETTCTSLSITAISAEATLVINPIPTVVVSASNALVCAGQAINLFGLTNPGSTYQWSGPNGFNSILQSPIISNVTSNSAGIYYLTVSLNNCASPQSSVAVSVSETTLSLLATTNVLCLGNPSTLSIITSASTYTWSNGSNLSSIIISPTVTSLYSVAVTNTANCTSSKSMTVSVVNPSITANNMSVCGSATNIILSVNAFTPSVINWFNSVNSTTILGTGQNYSLSVSTSTTLYAEASNSVSGCQSLRIPISLTLSPSPSLIIIANPVTICPSGSCTLTASGANTYSWSGLGIGASKVVSPTSSKVYTLTGKDSFSCSSTSTILVNTYAVAVITVAQSSSLVCPSSNASFTASGANSYIWNTGANGSITTVTPATNSTYTVYGTNTQSCISSKTLAINTKSVPVINIIQSTNNACAGEPITFTASGATSYTWLPGGAISNSFTAAPFVATVYNAIGKSINTCTNVGIVFIEVNPCTEIFENGAKVNVIRIFPNPSDGKFELEFKTNDSKKITLFSLEGKIVFEFISNKIFESINLSDMARGFYNIQIEYGANKINRKLILQ
ncbi:T9SS type A sorting domain-containing protein [Aurantibacillus circumpalustris]|uniref:T9SS type A sorting domain-containing protein n=1 Tax=Aurantibacillus circumpalustris TaxID=3036359 RepID=UPI00295BAA4C|nr:T9SS type A sorting domain-containing protein [Aurantibacillus circumpalustris]